jgi:integrase
MRRSELLNLHLADIQFEADERGKPKASDITLPAAITKTNKGRTVPVSARLAAVLEMRRYDPKGKELPPDAFVFGNEVGEPVKDFKTAWKLTWLSRSSIISQINVLTEHLGELV